VTVATTPRNTDRLLASSALWRSFPVGADQVAEYGWLAMIDQTTGMCVVGGSGAGYIGAGRFAGPIDATGKADGELVVDVDFGVFYWQNSGGADAIGVGDFGKPCYVVDNQTVALTDGTGTRSVAGIVYEVRADGQVGVRMDPTSYPSNP
jgi:hypothetical protein